MRRFEFNFVLLSVLGLILSVGCVPASPDMPKYSSPDIGGTPISDFKNTPQGGFTASGAPSANMPKSIVSSCQMHAPLEYGMYDSALKVGQKLSEFMALPIVDYQKLFTISKTTTLTSVSAKQIETHVVSTTLDGAKSEWDEVCNLILQKERGNYTSECRNKVEVVPAPPTSLPTTDPASEHCSLDHFDSKTSVDDSWTEGRYRFISGVEVSAVQHIVKYSGIQVCQTGKGPKVEKGTVTETHKTISSREAHDFGPSVCGGADIFMSEMTTGADGKLLSGYGFEKTEMPVSK